MRAEDHTLAFRPLQSRAVERAPRSLVDDFIRGGVFALLGNVVRGSISLVDGAGRFAFGRPGDAPSVTITVRDKAAYRAMVFGGSVGAGEAYMQGLWTCDDLPGLARILARNLDALDAMDRGTARLARRAGDLLRAARRRNTRAGSRRNIAQHYDLSNEFFRLFLDPSMSYSSAIFDREDASLGEAQQAKIERVCRKLDLGPDDHLLEIGTGWGGLAIHAARVHGCRVTTTTVSREQHRFASERVNAEGLGGRVDVLLRDYRDLEGQYDKLVSIEMIEAVGHEYLPAFFEVCAARLAPHGRMALQAITIEDRRYDSARREVDFIKRHIFPGSTIPSMTALCRAASSTDLRLLRADDIGLHYVETLRRWRANLRHNWSRLRALGFDDRLLRCFEFYFAYCEAGFAEGALGDVQLGFAKPGAIAAMPLPSERRRAGAARDGLEEVAA
jgi:cyclopropane-fatty-acyl-phospholipid synthase